MLKYTKFLWVLIALFLSLPIRLTYDVGSIFLAFLNILPFIIITSAVKKEFEIDLTKNKTIYYIFSGILAVLSVIAKELLCYDVFFASYTLNQGIRLLLVRVILFIAQSYILTRMYYRITSFLINRKFEINSDKKNFVQKMFENRDFKRLFLFHIISMLPYLIISYPGLLTYDPMDEILQFLGLQNVITDRVILVNPQQLITTHHNTLYTYMLGFVVKTSLKLFGNMNLYFLPSVLSAIFVIYAADQIFFYVSGILKNNKLLSYMFLVFCLHPFFPLMFIVMEKDMLFISLFSLFVIEYFKCLREEKYSILKSVVCCSFAAIIRNNAYMAFLPAFLIGLIISKGKRKYYLCLIVGIVATVSAYNTFNSYMDITKGSVSEALSIPFQQTARYVKCHDQEVTEYEREVIDTVLDYATLADRYSPWLADGVKDHYNKYATNEDLKNYFRVWGEMFFKHPLTYVEAFMANKLRFFTPFQLTEYMTVNQNYIKSHVRYAVLEAEYGIRISDIDVFNIIGTYLSKIQIILCFIPIVNIVYYSVIYVYALMVVVLQSVVNKNRRYDIFLLLQILYFGTILMGPANGGAFYRYLYPIIFSMPLFLLIYYENFDSNDSC